eukprot:scaffold9523_cov103-Cylindrotheca_fusiformis.AAC.12
MSISDTGKQDKRILNNWLFISCIFVGCIVCVLLYRSRLKELIRTSSENSVPDKISNVEDSELHVRIQYRTRSLRSKIPNTYYYRPGHCPSTLLLDVILSTPGGHDCKPARRRHPTNGRHYQPACARTRKIGLAVVEFERNPGTTMVQLERR